MTGSQTEYIGYRKARSEEVFRDAVILEFQKEDVIPLIEEVQNLSEILNQLIDTKSES